MSGGHVFGSRTNKVNAGSNTESFITSYKTNKELNERYVKHLKVEDAQVFSAFYLRKDFLGKGTFADVYSVVDKKNRLQKAMKIVDKSTLSYTALKCVEMEITILKMLYHPHIIELMEVLESSKKYYIIMEKCQHDLQQFLKKSGNMSESDGKRVLHDLSSAVAYLHRKDIVHRDIKAENVLIAENPHDPADRLFIKLSDFGLSIIMSGRNYMTMLHEKCGTITYMAPEILNDQPYSQQCDIWAVGVITYLTLMGRLPFEGKTDEQLTNNISTVAPDLIDDWSDECKDILMKMMSKNPAVRLTAPEILEHPWLLDKKLGISSQSHNVLDMMRAWNKDMRASKSTSALNIFDNGPTTAQPSAPPKQDNSGTEKSTTSPSPFTHTRITKVPKKKTIPVTVHNLSFDKQGNSKTGQ